MLLIVTLMNMYEMEGTYYVQFDGPNGCLHGDLDPHRMEETGIRHLVVPIGEHSSD